ncbi:hypothetical protein B0H19DRAFT_1199852 [Mycena capillaripes]|nr:hypothetical protein B0H19DRAFT_1199852 [Mycena capillaripes]
MVVDMHGSRSSIYIGTIPSTSSTALFNALSTITSCASIDGKVVLVRHCHYV